MAHKCFSIPRKPINEYAKLRRIQKGKKTSFQAWRQIEVLVLLDKKVESIAEIAEILEVGSKTITKWRNSYEKEGMKTLIFYEEKKSNKRSVGIRRAILKNAHQADEKETRQEENVKKEDIS